MARVGPCANNSQRLRGGNDVNFPFEWIKMLAIFPIHFLGCVFFLNSRRFFIGGGAYPSNSTNLPYIGRSTLKFRRVLTFMFIVEVYSADNTGPDTPDES